MKIVIIEDEKLTADDLAEKIMKAAPLADIIAILKSVKEAIVYFKQQGIPDLIFSDIQLGDGLSFEIFKSISLTVPVIFCTAYDEYALNAFKVNGIDYILKPYTQKTISEALVKFEKLKKSFSSVTQYRTILELFESKKNPKQVSVLVNYQDKILPVRIEDIALFYIENDITRLITFNQKNYSVNQTLGELEKIVGPDFYRANRQSLINRKGVTDASQDFSRKLRVNLSIPFKERIIIGKVKIPEFLEWLSGV